MIDNFVCVPALNRYKLFRFGKAVFDKNLALSKVCHALGQKDADQLSRGRQMESSDSPAYQCLILVYRSLRKAYGSQLVTVLSKAAMALIGVCNINARLDTHFESQ